MVELSQKEILINVHFTNKYLATNLCELLLYYKLRLWGKGRTGFFHDYPFTKNERYNTLPKIQKLGWVTGYKTNHYRGLVVAEGCARSYSAINMEGMKSIKIFKGTMLAMNEQYALRRNRRYFKTKMEKSRPTTPSGVLNRELSKVEVHYNDKGCIVQKGRPFIDDIVRYTKLGKTTINEWRRYSKEAKLNEYDSVLLCSNKSYDTARNMITHIRRMNGAHFKARGKSKIIFTGDCVVTSSVPIVSLKPPKVRKKDAEKSAKLARELSVSFKVLKIVEVR